MKGPREGEKSEPCAQYFNWFCKYLEHEFAAVKDSHFVQCTSTVAAEQLSNQSLDLCVVYNMAAVVASTIGPHADITLDNLVHGLIELGIFVKPETGGGAGGDRFGLMLQLVFMAIGWLSSMYDPDKNMKPGKLQIVNDTIGPGTRRRGSRIRTFEQDFAQTRQPLRTLLRVFGDVLGNSSQLAQSQLKDREFLTVGYLSYYTLSRVCNIKIEWVSNVSSHLDFLESSRVLKLYKHPSFCYMMYLAKSDEPLFNW